MIVNYTIILQKILLLCLFLISSTASGQNMKLLNYTTSTGTAYKIGSKVYLGTGTKDNQYFKYIRKGSPHSRSIVFSDFPPSLAAEYEGRTMTVKKIRQVGSQQEGYRVYLISEISGDPRVKNYWIDIEAAIYVGEVIHPY